MEESTCENGNGKSVEGKGHLTDFNRGIYKMLKSGILERGRGSDKNGKGALIWRKYGTY